MEFKPYQEFYVVPLSEAGNQSFAMLEGAMPQARRHTNVKRSVPSAGDDVGTGLCMREVLGTGVRRYDGLVGLFCSVAHVD